MLVIIIYILLPLAMGYMSLLGIYMVYQTFKDFKLDFGISHLNNLENSFFNREEKFNEIDSVMQEMIRSNPEDVLNDSAKQVLKQLFAELFPISPDYSLDSFIYFYPKLIQIKIYEPTHQPDSTKICHWGYVWISVPLIYGSGIRWVKFNKVDGDYSTEISVYELDIPENRGWHIYNEGCDYF